MGIAQDPKTKKWYFRKSIPASLITAYCELKDSKTKRPEFKRRFDTTSRKEAEALGHAAANEYNQRIALLKLRAVIPADQLRKIKFYFVAGGLMRKADPQQVDLELIETLKARVDTQVWYAISIRCKHTH